MKIQPIILAAGKGTRMNNPDIPKILVPINNRPIISYLLERVKEGEFLSPTLVVGYQQEKVRQELGDEYTYVVQEEQLGTGHAVQVCESALRGTSDILLIMNGDHPLWTVETMRRLVTEHVVSGAVLSLATLETDHPAFHNFGRIIRNEEGIIVGIREYKDCTEEERQIKEVNPSLFCINDTWLWDALKKIDRGNVQGEYYITDLLAIAVEEGKHIGSVKASTWQETLGINTPEQLQEVEKWI